MNFIGRLMTSGIVAASVAISFAPATAEDFYKGKQVTLVVGYGAGGGFDFFARVLATHYGRYIPGNPTVVVQNMPGASSVKAANYLFSAAKKDGTVLGALGSTLALNQLLGRPGKYDAGKFYWVGRLAAGDTVGIVWHAAGVKSVEGLKKKQVVWAGGSRMGPNVMLAAALNNLLGTQLKIVQGYKGSSKMIAAMEQQEAEATITGWSALKNRKSHLLSGNKVNVLFYMGYEREASLPNVPTLIEIGQTDEARQIFKLLTSREVVGRNYNAPPGIPAAQGATLRLAFDRMVTDKAFLNDIAKRKISISPMGGAKLQAVIEDVMKTDAALAQKLKAATTP